MVIIESELTQIHIDAAAELSIVDIRRSKLKIILNQINTIQLTSRTEIIPAAASIPAEMEEDGITIKTPAVAATVETKGQIFDVQPIDKNLGGIPMDDARRQQIFDNIVTKKAELGL